MHHDAHLSDSELAQVLFGGSGAWIAGALSSRGLMVRCIFVPLALLPTCWRDGLPIVGP